MRGLLSAAQAAARVAPIPTAVRPASVSCLVCVLYCRKAGHECRKQSRTTASKHADTARREKRQQGRSHKSLHIRRYCSLFQYFFTFSSSIK